ncbi:tRNA dihydrouridine synthase DUS3 [Aspergillus undulatus]|uniref:tRNA dihydrouridine synthase DUS3 n=1 Tax=Aspergillus undulatus TaxID=1810928 RepID=UPI003CCCC1A9
MDNVGLQKLEAEPPKPDFSNGTDQSEEPPMKKARLDEPTPSDQQNRQVSGRKKGTAPIKAEYLIAKPQYTWPADSNADDSAEAAAYDDRDNEKKAKKKNKGQNKARTFGQSRDERGLCASRTFSPEFSPDECQFGDKCKFEHDLRTYLKEHKRADLTTFNGICPVWDARGKCATGWKCRFVGSHMTERETEDGRKELVLDEDEERKKRAQPVVAFAEDGTINNTSVEAKMDLSRRRTGTPRADKYGDWLDETSKQLEQNLHGRGRETDEQTGNAEGKDKEEKEDHRATYAEPPFLPSEKRRLYFGPETPALAPLTTQGNLPFRRLCVELGAQLTYSEMALSMPLVQGHKPEWALMRAHETEGLPPTVSSRASVVQGYDNSKDMRFGAQIAGNKYRYVMKATEVLSALAPNLRVIDLNCGCPIDLLFREGSGSALLDMPSKLEKMLRGMNAVSQQIPITVKIRTGTKDNSPNAQKLVERLVLGGHEASLLNCGPAGVAAVTLHGRSRQQRYTREANWEYISETAALIKRLNEKTDEITDTIREPEERLRPNGGKTWFLGNGDCYSHFDHEDHIKHAGVDSVMVGRGALIKPWLFEEIQSGQYLDKSASERLAYIEKFAKYGMECWGSDEYGIGITRRFMLEWLSFTCRYVPIGLLEYLPPRLNDRPPYYRGRNDLETLLSSNSYKDWIKISEMFLGPAHKDFKFEPKHKSNAYEAEG